MTLNSLKRASRCGVVLTGDHQKNQPKSYPNPCRLMNLLPHEKVGYLERLREQGQFVANGRG